MIEVIPLILFLVCALQDYRTYQVYDIFVILLWCYVLLFGSIEMLVISFVFLWLFNTVGKQIFGWSDILGLPAFLGIIHSIEVNYLFVLIGFSLPIVFMFIKNNFKLKNRYPLYLSMFFGFVFWFILQLCG